MAELPYSFHLGSNKNRKALARSNARNNVSGSSSLANNGIQNYQQLSKVNNHDFRKYENDNDYIYQLKGTNDIVYDVKEFYKTEFEEARLNTIINNLDLVEELMIILNMLIKMKKEILLVRL